MNYTGLDEIVDERWSEDILYKFILELVKRSDNKSEAHHKLSCLLHDIGYATISMNMIKLAIVHDRADIFEALIGRYKELATQSLSTVLNYGINDTYVFHLIDANCVRKKISDLPEYYVAIEQLVCHNRSDFLKIYFYQLIKYLYDKEPVHRVCNEKNEFEIFEKYCYQGLSVKIIHKYFNELVHLSLVQNPCSLRNFTGLRNKLCAIDAFGKYSATDDNHMVAFERVLKQEYKLQITFYSHIKNENLLKIQEIFIKNQLDFLFFINWTVDFLPLFLAIQTGNIEIVKILMANGANIMIRDYENSTALHFAVIYSFEIFELFLQYQPDLYVKNCYDQSLIYYAIENSNWLAFQYLLHHTIVDFDAQDKFGKTLLYISITKTDDHRYFQILFESTHQRRYLFPTSCNTLYFQSILNAAVYCRRIKIIQILLNEFVDFNFKDPFGKSPLFSVIECLEPEILYMLLERNPNLNQFMYTTAIVKHKGCQSLLTHAQIVENICVIDEISKNDNIPVDLILTPLKLNYSSFQEGEVDEACQILYILLLYMKLYNLEINLPYNDDSDRLLKVNALRIIQNCDTDIKRLKSTKIPRSDVSLFELLICEEKFTSELYYQYVRVFFECHFNHKHYGIYGYILNSRYEYYMLQV